MELSYNDNRKQFFNRSAGPKKLQNVQKFSRMHFSEEAIFSVADMWRASPILDYNLYEIKHKYMTQAAADMMAHL
jgi:hypothetical protein